MSAKKKRTSTKPKALRHFAVKFRQTEMCVTVIDAVDETEARAKFDLGDWTEDQAIDTIDTEFVSMKEET